MMAELPSGVTEISCFATWVAFRLTLAWLIALCTRAGLVATALTRLWMADTWVVASGVVPWPWMIAVAAYCHRLVFPQRHHAGRGQDHQDRAAATGAARKSAGPSRWLPPIHPSFICAIRPSRYGRANAVTSASCELPSTSIAGAARPAAAVKLGQMNDQARRRSGRTSLSGPRQVAARLAGTVLVGSFLLAGCSVRAGRKHSFRDYRRDQHRRITAGGRFRRRRDSGQLSKILVIMEENHSIQQIFPGGMPYLWSLAQRYAYATDWSDVGHPSLPNYLAIFGGSAFNDPQDCTPSARLHLSRTIGLRTGYLPGQDGQGL